MLCSFPWNKILERTVFKNLRNSFLRLGQLTNFTVRPYTLSPEPMIIKMKIQLVTATTTLVVILLPIISWLLQFWKDNRLFTFFTFIFLHLQSIFLLIILVLSMALSKQKKFFILMMISDNVRSYSEVCELFQS